jgi:hypothetical protein
MKPARPIFTAPLVALLLAVFLAIAFRDVLFFGKTFFYRDFGVLAYPTMSYLRDSIWRGEIPLWNPYSNCGAPFLAQWGTMTLYPGSLFYLLFPMPWAANFFSLFHLWFGAMGLFLLARKWITNDLAAAFAASAFLFNGITLACLTWPNYAIALGWLPWVLLAMESAWGGGTRQLIYAAFAGAMQMFSGVPEIVLLTWFVVALLLGMRIWREPTGKMGLVRRSGLVILIIIGLTAVQLLPFFQLLSLSQRSGGINEVKWSLPSWGWGNFLLPMYHAFKTPEGTYWQYGQEFFSSTYLGITVLSLALVGSLKDQRTRLLGAATLFLAILALGSNGLVYDWIRSAIPFIGLARYPVKFLLLFPLIISLLAGFGIAELFQKSKRTDRLFIGSFALFCLLALLLLLLAKSHPLRYDRWQETLQNSMVRLAFASFISAAILWVSRLSEPRPLIYLDLLICIAVDGIAHLPNQNPTLPSYVLKDSFLNPKEQLVPPSLGKGRAFITPEADERLLHSSIKELEKDVIGKRMAEWSHLNLLDQVPKVNGSSTLQVRQQSEIEKFIYKTNSNNAALLDFLGATVQSSPKSPVEWVARESAMPLVTAGQEMLQASNLWERLVDFNPRKTAFLASEDLALPETPKPCAAQISDVNWKPHLLSFEANCPNTALAVIAQSWYPNWRGEVDGKPAALFRVNHAFQALIIPAGVHKARIIYRDNYFRIGAAISLLTFAFSLGLAVRGKRMQVK